MSTTRILTREEIDRMGPPAPEEVADTDVSVGFLADLALKHVAMLAEPTTKAISDRLKLPISLTEEILQRLYREKLIEIRIQAAMGATRYAMLDHGWERMPRLLSMSSYTGPAPVSLADYTHMIGLQALPTSRPDMDDVRRGFNDLVLPESLLQTLGCVLTSRRSLFMVGPAGTGKTAIAERLNGVLPGTIWIPYAVEVDGQIIRVFDNHNHTPAPTANDYINYDRRWVCIQRPLIMVGGELTLETADLVWSDVARFYEAPFQMKANGGTLVIDDLGRQRVAPEELLNRWIVPMEKRVDYLTLHTGKKIEVPFELLLVFSTNLTEDLITDEAFLRRMGYRARISPPSAEIYVKIFKRLATDRNLQVDDALLDYLLGKYRTENRLMKSCEPRDILNRITDICQFERNRVEVTPKLIDLAWANYFGTSHDFNKQEEDVLDWSS